MTGQQPSDEHLLAGLSPRQLDVLELVARGLTNEEIGRVLDISPTTARTHLTAILARLQVTNRTEAALAFARAAASTDRIEGLLAHPAVAVAPFASPAVADDLAATVAFGLTEDLVDLFARWCWFPVIRAVPGTPHGARYVVTGGVRAEGQAVRVTARLEDASEGHCLWTGRHAVDRAHVFDAREAIAAEIVAASYPRLLAASGVAAGRRVAAPDVSAWELAHTGFARLQRADAAANRDARDLFRRALAHDPEHVGAHYGLGVAAYTAFLNQWVPPGDAMRALEEASSRCLGIDPSAAEGHFLHARFEQTAGRFHASEAPLRRCVALNPSLAVAHSVLAMVLLMHDQTDEGAVRMEHAARFGPGAFIAGLAVARFCQGAYDAALSAADDAVRTKPGYVFAHVVATSSAWWAGDRAGACARYARLIGVKPDFSVDTFLRFFAAQDAEAVVRLAGGVREVSRAS